MDIDPALLDLNAVFSPFTISVQTDTKADETRVAVVTQLIKQYGGKIESDLAHKDLTHVVLLRGSKDAALKQSLQRIREASAR